MFQMLRLLSRKSLVLRQLPVFTVSFVLASVLYKFGSFALECVAFLATWFVLDASVQALGWVWTKARRRPDEAQPLLGERNKAQKL